MSDSNANTANHRISQLLGALFILLVVSALIAVLTKGAWHELGMSLVGGLLVLFVAVFIADHLIQKYNEEKFNPHRDYVYAILQKAITESFLKVIPPVKKSELHHADFGAYSSGYYEFASLDESRERYYEVFRNSLRNSDDFNRAVGLSRATLDEFIEKTRSLNHIFFTILDPALLGQLLHLEDAHNGLDVAVMDSGNSLDSKISLYSLCFINTLIEMHKLQQLLMSRATRRLSVQEWQKEMKAKVDRYTALERK